MTEDSMRPQRPQRIRFLLTFLAGVLAAGLVTAVSGSVSSFAATRYEDLSLFTNVLNIVRRNYVNSRDTPNETDPMAFSCCCERGGDEGITVEGTFGGIVENNIVEDTCAGIAARGDANSLTDTPQLSSKGNRILGNIALSLDGSAFAALSYCEGRSPCDTADVTDDTEIRDGVASRS